MEEEDGGWRKRMEEEDGGRGWRKRIEEEDGERGRRKRTEKEKLKFLADSAMQTLHCREQAG